MAETLSLIKRLHLRKIYILEAIDELTMEKNDIEQQINKLLFSTPYNKQKLPLRTHPCRAPSNFCKLSKISNELAEFLGKEKGTMMARADVTQEILKYIRLNNLKDSENKRNIKPDEKLSNLFNIPDSEQLTYFNIQKYIGHHCYQ